MKKFILLTCLVLGLLSERESYAAAKPKHQQASKKTPKKIESIEVCEEKCLIEINRVRAEHGLPALKNWKQLSDCAREHSANMAAEKCPFGHDGFDKRHAQMKKQATIYSFGENVACSYNYDEPVKIAVEGWMNSPGHKKNILGNFEESGIGVALDKKGKFYITQLFARRKSSPKQ